MRTRSQSPPDPSFPGSIDDTIGMLIQGILRVQMALMSLLRILPLEAVALFGVSHAHLLRTNRVLPQLLRHRRVRWILSGLHNPYCPLLLFINYFNRVVWVLCPTLWPRHHLWLVVKSNTLNFGLISISLIRLMA